jgi:hypothetical protein
MKTVLLGYDSNSRRAWLEKTFKGITAETVYLSESSPNTIVQSIVQVSLLGDLEPMVIVCDTDAAGRDVCIAAIVTIDPSRPVILSVADLPAAAQKKMEKTGWEFLRSAATKEKASKPDTFGMIRAWERGDKKTAWLSYADLVASGAAPEMIAGAMIWSLKQSFAKAAPAPVRARSQKLAKEILKLTLDARSGGISMKQGLEKLILDTK